MGWWKSERGMLGDGPADVMGNAIVKIENEYLEQAGRLPTQGELADLVEFCSNGCLRAQCGKDDFPFTKATAADKDTPRANDCGYQGALGPASMESTAAFGGMANIDPATGHHYGGSER